MGPVASVMTHVLTLVGDGENWLWHTFRAVFWAG